jgi:uncharacterized membrane protein (DUF2068 family)
MTPGPRGVRVEGIDVARGLASAIMIQGHAYDGWVLDAEKQSAAYLFTRLLGTLPLPSFLLLAGAAVALRIDSAIARREPARVVRTALVLRGLFVLATGYAVNAVYALMDGYEGAETFVRVDVLHAIGLSIAALGLLGVREREGQIDRRTLAIAAAGLAVVPVVLCVPISRALWNVEPPAAWLVGLISFVPDVTRMPFVPLAAWTGLGALVSLALIERNRESRSLSGSPDRVLLTLAAIALLVAVVFTWLTGVTVRGLGGSLDQRHWAVVPNAIELGARGALVLAAGALLSGRLPAPVRAGLGRLGRGSLVAYVFHIPFCYGALGEAVRGRLTMVEATGLVVVLAVASYLAVVLRDRIQELRASRARARQNASRE